MEAGHFPDSPGSKPKKPKALGLIAVLVTIATLLGGVAAVIQIWQSVAPKPTTKTAPSKSPSQSNETTVIEGVSFILPENWTVIDASAVRTDAEWNGLGDIIERQERQGAESAFLIYRNPSFPDRPTRAFVISTPNVDAQTIDGLESAMGSNQDYLGVARVSLGDESAVRFQQRFIPPDPRDPDIITDAFALVTPEKLIMVMTFSDPSEHLENATALKNLAETIRLK